MVLNVLFLMMLASNMFFSFKIPNGLTPQGKMFSILLLAGVVALILLALFLKSRSQLLLANILLWISAAPFAIGLAVTIFLAVAFTLFGK